MCASIALLAEKLVESLEFDTDNSDSMDYGQRRREIRSGAV